MKLWKYAQPYSSLSCKNKKEDAEKLLKKIAQNMRQYTANCSFSPSENIYHSYTIKDIRFDENNNISEILMINPSDSEIIEHKTFEEFLAGLNAVYVINSENNYEELNEGFLPNTITHHPIEEQA